MSLFSEVIVDHMVIDNDNSDENVRVRDFLPYLVLRSRIHHVEWQVSFYTGNYYVFHETAYLPHW